MIVGSLQTLDKKDFMSKSFCDLNDYHSLHTCNYALPEVNFFYRNFALWVKYEKGPQFCVQKHKLRKFYEGSNLIGYLGQRNPLNRFQHSIKGYMFLPGSSLEQYKNVEFYCENLVKETKKLIKKVSSSIMDFEILPSPTGIYFNIYSKLPKLSLETLSDLFKAMGTLAGSSYKKTLNEETVKTSLKKWEVLNVAHHLILSSLSLQVDEWEGNLASNFLSVAEIAKKTLYSKSVLFFFGDFNVDDCKKKTEYMSKNFCYQREDFYQTPMVHYGVLQPNKPIILQHLYQGGPRNSAMIAFYQTRVDDFFDFYGISDRSLADEGRYTVYQIAKVYTMLANHFIYIEYFHSLRSQHCMGYHVYSRVLFRDGMLGIGFFAQTSENCPATSGAKTKQFLEEIADRLTFTDETIQEAIEAALKKPLDRTYEKPDYLYRIQEIFMCNDSFAEYIKLPNIVDDDFKISAADFKSFLTSLFLKKPCSLQVHVVGEDHRDQQEAKLTEVRTQTKNLRVFDQSSSIRALLPQSEGVGASLLGSWGSN